MFFTRLQHRVRVDSLTTTQDDSGGTVEAYTTRQASVKCLITQQSGSTTDEFGTETKRQTHTVSMTYMGVQRGDRLYVISGPTNAVGKYLTVNGITNHGGVGNIDPYCRLSCTQVVV